MHHVFVFAGQKSLVLHTAAGLGPSLITHLDHYWIREDLGFHDRSDEWGEVILAGPHAAGIIKSLTSANVVGGDSYLANYDLSWNRRPLMIRRWRERGFDSFHLAADAAEIGTLWQSLRQLGAKACGMKALEAIRIEEGFPVIGLDVTDKNLPQEVGRNEKAISFTKGCYLGQEIVARIDSRAQSPRCFAAFASSRPKRRPAAESCSMMPSLRGRSLRPRIRPASRRASRWPTFDVHTTNRAWCSIRRGGRQRWLSCR